MTNRARDGIASSQAVCCLQTGQHQKATNTSTSVLHLDCNSIVLIRERHGRRDCLCRKTVNFRPSSQQAGQMEAPGGPCRASFPVSGHALDLPLLINGLLESRDNLLCNKSAASKSAKHQAKICETFLSLWKTSTGISRSCSTQGLKGQGRIEICSSRALKPN